MLLAAVNVDITNTQLQYKMYAVETTVNVINI